MRGLTIRQPWASCIVEKGKRVENRTWSTDYRGPLLIHAGQGIDNSTHAGSAWLQFPAGTHRVTVTGIARSAQEPGAAGKFAAVERGTVGQVITPLPLGSVIAVAELVDVHPCWTWDAEHCCDSPWAETGPKTYHWVLDDVRTLEEPIQAKGKLGLWHPDSQLIHDVEVQL